MFCSKCGYQNADDAIFCSSCGLRMEASTRVEAGTRVETSTRVGANSRENSKKGFIIGWSIVLAAIAIFLIYAFSTGLFTKAKLKGTWYQVDGNERIVIDDNSIKVYDQYDDLEGTIKYSTSGDTLTLDYGNHKEYVTYKVEGNELYIYAGGGDGAVYSKTPNQSY